ncbi:MAG TPA: thiamine-phosphate kinase [Rhizomicrobium sp.]|jgi:thiamine-monophosphate kinase|nr:thiamine-phosphate kinase [Rhizomicrobium sp.]
MTSPDPPQRPGEFELIAKLFAPLARDAEGAFGLADDVAVLGPRPGMDVVFKCDSLIESVHFLRDDPPATVARKALRRALSDLAAKGAEPGAYLLALALPPWPDLEWLEAFAGGLAADQAEFGISLIGGETDATPGPVTITVTAIGHVPQGALIRRNGARPGDLVFVTGTIGDAGAGLSLLKDGARALSDTARNFLLARYRVPVPRLAFGRGLRALAAAAIDISDGLAADLGHIAETSGVRIEIDAARVPLSAALRELRGDGPQARLPAAGAGDDYEIAFTAASSNTEAILGIADRTLTPVAIIGSVVAGRGVAMLDATGREISLAHTGYTHF